MLAVIHAKRGSSNNIAKILHEEWLARNFAEGELVEFYEEVAVSYFDIHLVLEKRRLQEFSHFSAIKGFLQNETCRNEENYEKLSEKLKKLIDLLTSQFNIKVFDKSNLYQIMNQIGNGTVKFYMILPWKTEPVLNQKHKSKIYISK